VSFHDETVNWANLTKKLYNLRKHSARYMPQVIDFKSFYVWPPSCY
jgi:hypothetical protein